MSSKASRPRRQGPRGGRVAARLASSSGASRTPGVRRELAEVPPVIWAIVVMFAALLVIYSTLFPPYRAPDESHHMDMVLAARYEQWRSDQEGRQVSSRIMESFGPARFVRLEVTPLAADDAPPRSSRPSFDDFGPTESTPYTNAAWAHPPLYYAASAAVWVLTTAVMPFAFDWSFAHDISFLRLLNAVTVTPLPLLAYLTIRRLWADQPAAAVAGAAATLTIPQLTHMGSVVSNDPPLILAGGILTYLTTRVLTGDDRWRAAAWIGAVAGLALLIKGFSLVMLPWVVLAYTVAALKRRHPLRLMEALGRIAVALGVAFVLGGWWWLRNLLTLGTIQPLPGTPEPAAAGFEPDIGFFVRSFVGLMVQRFWGSFSRYEVDLPVVAVALATVVLLAGVVIAATRATRGARAQLELTTVATLLFPLVGCYCIVAYGSFGIYAESGVIAAAQGRYLLTALVGMLTLFGIGAAWVWPSGRLTGVVIVMAATMHCVAARAILATYWGPATGAAFTEQLRAVVAWYPFGPVVPIAALCLLAGGGAVALALSAVQREESSSPRSPDDRRDTTSEKARVHS